MLDQPPVSPPAIIAPDAQPPGIPADLRAVLDMAIEDGDASAIEKLFDYARRASPAASAAIADYEKGYRQQVASRKREQQDARRERLARADPLANWSGQIEFGASRTTGAIASTGVLGSVEVERAGLAWTHKLVVRGELQDTDGTRVVERLLASWQPRRAIGDTAYVFGLGQYEHDPILGYDDRYSAGFGAGLRVDASDRLKLSFEGGPAVRRTEFEGAGRTGLAGRASADLNWALSPRLTFQQKASAYYESGQANGILSSALDTKVSSKVKLRLSYEYRYEDETVLRNSGSISRASIVYSL